MAGRLAEILIFRCASKISASFIQFTKFRNFLRRAVIKYFTLDSFYYDIFLGIL